MSTSDIPLDKAELLGIILEGILYGFSLLMFGGTIWQLLLSRRYTHRVNRKMLTVACLLLFFSTVHLVIDIIRTMEGLILYRDTYPGGPTAFFSDWSQWTFVSKNYVYTIQSLIGDSVILYRCYVVWRSKLLMILPALLWCAAGVTGFGSPSVASQMSQNDIDVFGGTPARWIKSFYATAFATNVLTTFLLASRIWYIDQKVAKLRGHPESQLREMLHIIVDAGVIYFLTLLAALISFVLQSNSQFVILDMIVPIISITFYMVIIRVGWATRANQPWLNGHSDTPTRNGFCVDRMQLHITTMNENRDDDGRSTPTSPVTADGGKNRRTPSEIKLDNAGEAV